MSDFEKIYREHFNDVFLYALRLSGDKSIAEDITADTFLKAMRSLDTFRGDCEPRIWLCQIAKNTYFSHLKKQRCIPLYTSQIPETADPAETPEERAVCFSEAERIRRHLHTLAEPYKEVFMWRVFAELSFSQIGGIFGKTENWACVTYHRAKKMISEEMNKEAVKKEEQNDDR